jgi:hypothetical protein
MKVLNIEKTPKADGGFLWIVTLAKKDGSESKPRLHEHTEPNYDIGYEIYASHLELIKPDEGSWYYKRKDGGTQMSRGPAQASRGFKAGKAYSKDDNAIMVQVAFKGAIEAEGYWYVPDGKAHTDRVIQNTDDLVAGLQEIIKKRFANPLVEEAKKLGAQEVQ